MHRQCVLYSFETRSKVRVNDPATVKSNHPDILSAMWRTVYAYISASQHLFRRNHRFCCCFSPNHPLVHVQLAAHGRQSEPAGTTNKRHLPASRLHGRFGRGTVCTVSYIQKIYFSIEKVKGIRNFIGSTVHTYCMCLRCQHR